MVSKWHELIINNIAKPTIPGGNHEEKRLVHLFDQTKREGIGWAWRLRMNQELLGLLDKPEKFLSKVHGFEMPAGVTPADLIQADNKTLRDIGLIEK